LRPPCWRAGSGRSPRCARPPEWRGFASTFAGLAINHVPVFVAAEFFGAIVAALMCAAATPCRSSKVAEPNDGEEDRAMP
jgi:hypothetical protein